MVFQQCWVTLQMKRPTSSDHFDQNLLPQASWVLGFFGIYASLTSGQGRIDVVLGPTQKLPPGHDCSTEYETRSAVKSSPLLETWRIHRRVASA